MDARIRLMFIAWAQCAWAQSHVSVSVRGLSQQRCEGREGGRLRQQRSLKLA